MNARSDSCGPYNLFPDQVVSLRASPNPRPRCEFLTANSSIGFADLADLRTQAYVDTLASSSFLSTQYFEKLQRHDPQQQMWRPTGQYFDFNLAVGTEVHQAQVIEAQLIIDSFRVHHHFGVAPIETFDCILGVDFCHQFLLNLNWQQQYMKLQHPDGTVHKVQGDTAFIKSRKLDLIVPPAEIQGALSTKDCLFLMVQPLDNTQELTSEEIDTSSFRSRLSDKYTLTPPQQQQLDCILQKYSACFEKRTSLPTERVPGESFRIQLEAGTQPVHRNYYRLSPQQQEALRELLAEYVDAGKMDICAGSSWGAPVLLIPKKDGGWRVVFDYRILNMATVKDRYPLPRIDDLLQNLRGSAIFSSVDALDGFHQVPMDTNDIDKTAVVTPFGSYVWRVMPMGLANAPAMFQRMMNRIFGALPFLKVYMDDILVHSANVEQHFKHLEEFLEVCLQNDIRLKRSKCYFFHQTLEWVGFRIQAGQLSCADHLVQRIQKFPKPTTHKQNLAFLGLCQFYMRFVRNYAEMAAPLTELTRRQYRHDFARYWKTQHDQAFNQLVHMLTTGPVLQLFNEDRPIRVETDASDFGMGAVLLQQTSPDNWQPVEYYSKKFNSAQKNYHPAEKETCAIVYALQHWRHLLFGQHFTVLTDNKASMYLQTKSAEQLSPRDQRWAAKLAYFAPFAVEYRPGAQNLTADYLSRNLSESESRVVTILDLCAGAGTVLRALWHLIPAGYPVRIDYIAVEIQDYARKVIQRIFADVSLDRPGLFVRSDIFRYGNDVRVLAGRRKLPSVHLLIAGVPCQPFSRANTSLAHPSYGLRDERELFTVVHSIYKRLHKPDYIIECTPFAAHLQEDFQTVSDLFGEPQLHDLSLYCPQQRSRYCWTSLPISSRISHIPGLPLTWQECLQKGATVPTDRQNQPITKCPTLMASSNSHSDRNRSTWVHDHDGNLRPLEVEEKERLVGLEPGDTAAENVSTASRHRLCGNAFPVAWIANLLDLHFKTPTGTLRPLACRSLAKTVSVQGSGLRILSALTDPHSLSYTQRLRAAAQRDPQYTKWLQSPPPHLRAADGLLFHKNSPNQLDPYGGPAVVLVPADNALRQDLLHLVHDQTHFGAQRTLSSAKRHFTWPGIKQQVQQFVTSCPTCQLQKPGTTTRHQPYFAETKFYPYPFHTIVLDVVEGLPLTAKGHNGVLTVVDRFTKFAIYIAIHTSWSAFRQAQCLLDSLVYRFHTPQRIHTDNGPAYRKLFQAFCAGIGTQHTTGTPYHSQSQGGAERQHRTLLQQLRLNCDDRKNWDDYLQAAAHAYNDSEHAVTKVAPFTALFGCPSRLPWHLQLMDLKDNANDDTQTVSTLDQRIGTLLEQQRHLYKHILQHLHRQAKKIDALRAELPNRTFQVGDQVKVQYGLKGPTDKNKLDPYYVGPFTIAEVLGKGAYRLQLPADSPYSDRFNADRLAFWYDSDMTLFPTQEPNDAGDPVLPVDTHVEPTVVIQRYLLRDYQFFPQHPVRYWAKTTSTSEPCVWINETSELLDEFLPLEENNGCIPEQGITPNNINAVEQHKKQVYLQSPAPILVNTWTFARLPLQVRRRPKVKKLTDLQNAVVEQLFHISDHTQAYYQGQVYKQQGSRYWVRWTDGVEQSYTSNEIQAMLYDPISYVYDFLPTRGVSDLTGARRV